MQFSPTDLSDLTAKLTAEIAQLKGLNEAALTERDFYWSKLREVEILMQTKNQVSQSVLRS